MRRRYCSPFLFRFILLLLCLILLCKSYRARTPPIAPSFYTLFSSVPCDIFHRIPDVYEMAHFLTPPSVLFIVCFSFSLSILSSPVLSTYFLQLKGSAIPLLLHLTLSLSLTLLCHRLRFLKARDSIFFSSCLPLSPLFRFYCSRSIYTISFLFVFSSFLYFSFAFPFLSFSVFLTPPPFLSLFHSLLRRTSSVFFPFSAIVR